MTLLHAIALGIIQGATEFLPVSSSGHLLLAQDYLGIQQPSLFFEVLLHVGTLFAVLLFYRYEIFEVIRDLSRGIIMWINGDAKGALELEGVRISLFVVVASLPTAFIGLTLNKYLDPGSPESIVSIPLVGSMLLINGLMLYSYRWLEKYDKSERLGESELTASSLNLWGITLKGACLIGIAQGIAILPGISRSGSTITAGLLLGLRREDAARYSFLISIPAIVGAFLLKLKELNFSSIEQSQWLSFGLGAIVAGLVGLFCLRWLISLLKATKFYIFAYYCWFIGMVALVISYLI